MSTHARGVVGGGVEVAVDLAGEVALEAAADLSGCASFGGPAFDVGAGARVHAHACHDGHVQARLSRRSPPRLIRWRTVLPEEAGMGLTPARLAKAASERS